MRRPQIPDRPGADSAPWQCEKPDCQVCWLHPAKNESAKDHKARLKEALRGIGPAYHRAKAITLPPVPLQDSVTYVAPPDVPEGSALLACRRCGHWRLPNTPCRGCRKRAPLNRAPWERSA